MRTKRYTTGLGRTSFSLSDGIVWVHTATRNVGGWRLDRYGDSLGIAWVRAWAAENLVDAAVTA